MSIDPNGWARAAIASWIACVGLACGGMRPASAPARSAAAANAPRAAASAMGSPAARNDHLAGPSPADASRRAETKPNDGDDESDEDAELVVSRDVVAACPTLRLVRLHMGELDQDMVWLAVLEAIADCMGERGPMAQQNIGVSGDEEHRHIVREVLGTHGIAPTRVVARPASSEGAAECQGGALCGRRVEITILVP